MLRLRLRLRSFETLLSGLELRLLETDFSLQFPFSTTSGWWLPLLERDRLFTEVGDCDFSLDEFRGVSDSTDLLLLFELLSCGECDVDRLLDRDFRGEECAFDSTELRDLERLERSTALEGDGDRSNCKKGHTKLRIFTKQTLTTTLSLYELMMRQCTNLLYFAFCVGFISHLVCYSLSETFTSEYSIIVTRNTAKMSSQ